MAGMEDPIFGEMTNIYKEKRSQLTKQKKLYWNKRNKLYFCTTFCKQGI